MIQFADTDQMRLFARMLAEELANINCKPEADWISFREARAILGISDDTLTRRIRGANIRTWRQNGGKAFRRKDIHKLQ